MKITSKNSPRLRRKLIRFKQAKSFVKQHLFLFALNYLPFTHAIFKAVTSYSLVLTKFINIENLLITCRNNVELLGQHSKSLCYSMPVFDVDKNDRKIEVAREIVDYTALFRNVGIIGGSSIVIFNEKYALYDLKFHDKNSKFKFTDEGIKYYSKDFCWVKYKFNNTAFKEGILMTGNYSFNYYHMLYEICIKFQAVDKFNFDCGIPLIVDEVCVKTPQFNELLQYLNKNKRQILVVPAKGIAFVERLYYVSSPNVIPPNFQDDKCILPDDLLFDACTVNELRNNLLPHSSGRKFPERIYLSRKNVNGRRKFNEDEVFSILEKYGFEAVFPEDYSIADQISLFSNADFIVGGSGAAFANLLFCKSGCKAVILYKNKLPFSGFSTIATIVGVRLLYLTDEKSKVEDMYCLHENFTINPASLEAVVSRWS